MKTRSDPFTCTGHCTATDIGTRATGGTAQSLWMATLQQLAFAALRLHEYRYLRTRMFHAALDREGKKGGVETGPAQTTDRH